MPDAAVIGRLAIILRLGNFAVEAEVVRRRR